MCAEKNYPDNVYKFPTPEERQEDPRDRLFKKAERPEQKSDEPEILKNIPDMEVIKNILVNKDGAEYKFSKKFELQPGDRRMTFGVIREVLEKSPNALKKSSKDLGIISAYVDFIIDDFKEKIPDNDLLNKAELYKYLGKIYDKLIVASTSQKDVLKATHEVAINEVKSQFHLMAGNLFKKLAAVEKNPTKKEYFNSECISEYLEQAHIYELKKKMSEAHFEEIVEYIIEEKDKIIAKNNLKQTLKRYDGDISLLSKQILKLMKIK